MKKIKRFSFSITLGLALSLCAVVSAEPSSALEKASERGCQLAYYPSSGVMAVQVDFRRNQVRLPDAVAFGQQLESARVTVLSAGGDVVLAEQLLLIKEGISPVTIFELSGLGGDYIAQFELKGVTRSMTVVRPFERLHFDWEGNQIGLTDKVYPPFSAVMASPDGEVSVVGRTYWLDGLGLMKRIESLEKAILAEPMQLRYALTDGTSGALKTGTPKLVSSSDSQAVYRGRAIAPFIEIDAVITVEFDGMNKLEWTLKPGSNPQEIERLWIDIPMKADGAYLMHNVTDGNRIHHSGELSQEQGVIWTSADARRYIAWQNTFNPYLWVGAEARGLAWYAENDKGWLTERGGSKKPIQQIIRRGDVMHIEVSLLNHPSAVEREHHIVFALQASPTKPQMKGWRAQYPSPPGMSGPVNPWGGFQCSDKYPYLDDWTVVDKIIEARETGEVDREWFEQWADENDPPLVHGHHDWLTRTVGFAAREKNFPQDYPTLIYFEEMRASTFRPEWQTYQDEWGIFPFTDRSWAGLEVMRRGFDTQGRASTTFAESYRQFGAWYADEWLKRGIGLYWDNTYPQPNYDPLNSNAYVTEDGQVQPAMGIFSQREYMKRIWNVLGENRKNNKSMRPLHWAVHMTNTLLLPLQTFATIQLDNELPLTEPLDPGYIRTEMLGLKTGNISHALFPVSGKVNPQLKELGKWHKKRIEWGMRRVHEIVPDPGFYSDGGPWEKVFRGFGYGDDSITIVNYWDRPDRLKVEPDTVRWIELNDAQGQRLIVLSSWDPDLKEAQLTLGEAPVRGYDFYDAETAELLASKTERLTVKLKGPYGMRILLASPAGIDPHFAYPLRTKEAIIADFEGPKAVVSKKKKSRVSVAPQDPYRGVSENTILFRDDFNDEVSADWLKSEDVEIIASEGSNSSFARFTKNRGRLISPPAIPHNVASTAGKADDMEEWSDYAFRFRFRIGPYTMDESNPSPNATFLSLSWHIDPSADAPGLSDLTYLQLWRHSKEWRMAGPYVNWNGRNERMAQDSARVSMPHGPLNIAMDHEWHELEVQMHGERRIIALDGEVVFDGDDDRTQKGGFSILAIWDDRAVPEYIDIDDVVAWKIDRIALRDEANYPAHIAARVEQAPTIDGQLDDDAWAIARRDEAGRENWVYYRAGRDEPLAFDRESWLTYDDEYLYIGMEAEVDDPANLKMSNGGNAFLADCLEIHLKRADGRYFHCALSVDGDIASGLDSDFIDMSQVKSATSFTSEGWAAEVAIPWELLEIDPAEAQGISFNLAANVAYQEKGRWTPVSSTRGVFGLLEGGPVLRLGTIEQGVMQPLRVSAPPLLDGALEESFWAKVPSSGRITNLKTLDGKSLAREREARFAYDNENLYVAMVIDLGDSGVAVADGENGDTLQLDFAGYSLGVDAAGSPLPILLPYLIPSQSAVGQSDGKWIIELSVPWEHLSGRPEAGETRAFNLGGNDGLDGTVSWMPVLDLRDESNYGTLKIND